MIHNESVNVWSHLIGAIFFLVMLIYIPLKMSTPAEFDFKATHLLSSKAQCPWI
jgi:predicted membrane channel-forming protein YqfA (hemolysin III family)